MARVHYDEFSFFHENAAEWGLPIQTPPVSRDAVVLADGRSLSYLRFNAGSPQVVFIHGGAQNAHTFDTVNLALAAPSLALDLPGHGHSAPSPYGLSAVASHAADVVNALRQLCDQPVLLVGMSLGGLTSLLVARDLPELVHELVLVDITPGVTAAKAKHITDFVNGPRTFEDFEQLVELTIRFNPTRSESSLRRGILHNAVQRDDDTWVWRHQQHAPATLTAPPTGDLWEVLGALSQRVTLVRGMAAGSVVDDEDVSLFHQHCPQGTVVNVEGAGHSVQGDQPLVLAALCAERLSR
jgi:pimeloyl-ACP methyl ester carboxylesterase